MSSIRISVYITSYNQKDYLVEAIESVLAQTLPASQIIIVDDCSQDDSQEVIAGYKSRYPELITPIYHTQNYGVARTRVDALQAVTGNYVTYVDGDDRYLPTKLEREARLLQERSDAQIAFSNNYYMTDDGQHVGMWITNKRPPEGHVFRETFARDFPRGNLFRMELLPYEAWRRVGFHDVNLRLLEDWDMRIRLAKHYRVVYYDEPLTEIRRHGRGLASLRAAEKLTALNYIWAKNKALLDDVGVDEREYITNKVSRWRANFIRRQAKEELGAYHHEYGSKRRAIAFYRESLKHHRCLDFEVILGLALPYGVYRRLRTVVRQARSMVGIR